MLLGEEKICSGGISDINLSTYYWNNNIKATFSSNLFIPSNQRKIGYLMGFMNVVVMDTWFR